MTDKIEALERLAKLKLNGTITVWSIMSSGPMCKRGMLAIR